MVVSVVYILFFFSSRRRHTRLQGDWSSDVCSSDLIAPRERPRGRSEAPRDSRDYRPQNRLDGSRPNYSPNRPPSRAESSRPNSSRPNFNENRPPERRYQDLNPQEKRSLAQREQQLKQLSPQQRRELQDRARVWQRMTPQQRDHIKNEILPRWQQLPQDRQRAIQNRLGVLQNMPEAARNRHLNDPNFTRGMSEDDREMLRDLSHQHVGGAPDPPNE